MTGPLLKYGRLIRDLSMPARDWGRYDEPAYKRNPGYVTHARARRKPGNVVEISCLLRRQAQ